MTFPVNSKAANKKVCLYDGDELLFDFDCRIDNINPDFTAYVDVSRFIGRRVELKIEPKVQYKPEFAKYLRSLTLWREPYRPEAHFTVKNGWINDPNGLVFRDGVYHMFYQYNPMATVWGNMHWGHAQSRDLLHWEEKDIALFPDEKGTVFSGSAIVDTENVAGLGKDTILLYYTAAGGTNLLSKGEKFTQCLAYSLDGETFVKYDGNPVLSHIEGANRDPKVIYVEEIEKYVMALFLSENRYALLSSTDLVNWTKIQEITLCGDAECPDIFALDCDGERHYVFIGAHDVYLVGSFKNGVFEAYSPEKKLTHLKMSYAGQSFFGLSEGRVVRMSWHNLNLPTGCFASQMSIPTEMRLERQSGEYYLCAAPIEELKSLYIDGGSVTDASLKDGITLETGAHALDLSLSMPYVSGEKVVINLFGTDLAVDMEKNEIRCKNLKMPISVSGETVDLRVICDRLSLEIFADGGKIFAAVAAFADYNLPRVTVNANEKVSVGHIGWHTLKNIHT